MVCRLIFISLFFSTVSFAGTWDNLLGPAEPSYVKAIAPRFATWSLQNFEITPSSQRKAWKDLFAQESAVLTEWTFFAMPDFAWPRLQLGLKFEKGNEKDSYVLIFPQDPANSLRQADKILKLSNDLKIAYIGFGFSLRKDEVYIFNADLKTKRIRKTVFVNGKRDHSLYLAATPNPQDPKIHFSSLVSSWRGWFNEADELQRYEMTLDRFNLRFLDGAAIAIARKVNAEFLLNNLRITYKAIDDYDVLYP